MREDEHREDLESAAEVSGTRFADTCCNLRRVHTGGLPWPSIRYADLESGVDEMVVIEDRSLFCRNDAGDWAPGLEFIDSRTLRAHPLIIETLLVSAERLWSAEELLVP